MAYKKFTDDVKVYLFGLLSFIVIAVMLFLAAIVTGCTSSTARANIPESETYFKENLRLKEVVKAYDEVLDRVWADNPDYALNVLSETNEYQNLVKTLNK